MDTVVLMTDHSSTEGSRFLLEKAVEIVTGTPPLSVDARHFMDGGEGRAVVTRSGLRLEVPPEDLITRPDVLIVYEIPPTARQRFAAFQRELPAGGRFSFAADPQAWRNATDKGRTVDCFRRDGIAHTDTVALTRPKSATALDAFDRLGRDVWARPTVGAGGNDVFHLTTPAQVDTAMRYYAASGQDWLLSRDARNFTKDGRRHQFRVVVLGDRVLRVCEHVQADPDAPCNESQGAVSTVLPIDALPAEYHRLAIAATRSLGLPFGGVDLVTENGGAVFEVNVHPVIEEPGGLDMVAVPFVQAACSSGFGTRAVRTDD
ncbi:alpha-L-glutamate ligase [Kitasatospora sp. NPDC097691]|uniref:ATP-grasp domain-containing protein n=1 Tax=Kitasatospora sp. NPDC097691 TaxID=3157231 RepID=UPI00331EA921